MDNISRPGIQGRCLSCGHARVNRPSRLLQYSDDRAIKWPYPNTLPRTCVQSTLASIVSAVYLIDLATRAKQTSGAFFQMTHLNQVTWEKVSTDEWSTHLYMFLVRLPSPRPIFHCSRRRHDLQC